MPMLEGAPTMAIGRFMTASSPSVAFTSNTRIDGDTDRLTCQERNAGGTRRSVVDSLHDGPPVRARRRRRGAGLSEYGQRLDGSGAARLPAHVSGGVALRRSGRRGHAGGSEAARGI